MPDKFSTGREAPEPIPNSTGMCSPQRLPHTSCSRAFASFHVAVDGRDVMGSRADVQSLIVGWEIFLKESTWLQSHVYL